MTELGKSLRNRLEYPDDGLNLSISGEHVQLDPCWHLPKMPTKKDLLGYYSEEESHKEVIQLLETELEGKIRAQLQKQLCHQLVDDLKEESLK